MKTDEQMAEEYTLIYAPPYVPKTSDLRNAYLAGRASMRDEADKLQTALKYLEQSLVIGADGTNLRCSCPRPNCHSLWFSAGDVIFTLPYYRANEFMEIIEPFKEKV